MLDNIEWGLKLIVLYFCVLIPIGLVTVLVHAL